MNQSQPVPEKVSKEVAALYSAILQQTPNGIALVDKDTLIRWVNPSHITTEPSSTYRSTASRMVITFTLSMATPHTLLQRVYRLTNYLLFKDYKRMEVRVIIILIKKILYVKKKLI